MDLKINDNEDYNSDSTESQKTLSDKDDVDIEYNNIVIEKKHKSKFKKTRE